MARVSFTLRSDGIDKGSYIRYQDGVSYATSGAGGASVTHAARTDYDSALRADGLQIAPLSFVESYFEATSVCYGEVSLKWEASLSASAGALPTPVGLVMVYSSAGEPQTMSAGKILVESATDLSFEHTGLPEGRWAYYSLFVNYKSSIGDDYFERVASLSVLVPKNYQSNLTLWNRIPEYYRTQDIKMGTIPTYYTKADGSIGSSLDVSPCIGNTIAGEPVGPLFKMLSVIGFDIDRIRTLIDYIMVANDPALANGETLDALSDQMAVMMNSADLGTARLRNLMESIGYFRRTKGTLEGTNYFTKAVSGCDIEVNKTTAQIKVYSQRTNYITVPKTGTGIVTYRAAGTAENVTPLLFSDTTYNAFNANITYTASTFTNSGAGFATAPNLMVRIGSVVPVLNTGTDRVVFSVHSGVGTEGIVWARLVNASTGAQLGFQNKSVLVDGVRAFEVTATGASAGASAGWLNTYVEILVNQQTTPTFVLTKMLAERNYIGQYFDGSTVRGGWLVDSSSVSDYRWSGSANASPSIFTEDYERTKDILRQMIYDVLPITEADKYTITSYNAIPGL